MCVTYKFASFPSRLAKRMQRIVSLLLIAGLGAYASGAPSLHKDIANGSIEALRKHMDKGADLSERSRIGLTPLHAALMARKREMALELIRRGADINARTLTGMTPLILAVRNDDRDVVDVLLERNAVIEFYPAGPSPLFEAIVANNRDMFERLVSAGARINRRDHDGRTPLHFATEFARVTLVERLLELGADINAALPDGRTPLHVAVGGLGAVTYTPARNPAIADLLYARGATVTAAQGEVGGYTTALVYRFAAQKEYAKRDTVRSAEYLQLARSVLLSEHTLLNERGDAFATKVMLTRTANAVRLVLGQASANISASTNGTGVGFASVALSPTSSNVELRDSYRRVTEWCAAEAQRIASLQSCVTGDPGAVRACFSPTPK
jgi:hypothetical protein